MKHLLSILLTFFTTYLSVNAQSFTIEGPETICKGTPATLTVTGCAGALQWSTGETTVSITIRPTASTLYSATCTEAGSNPTQVTHSVGVFPTPTLTASTPNLCSNENVVLSTNTTEYTHNTVLWKRDGQPIVSGGGAYVANEAGRYTVEDNITPGIWVPYPAVPTGTLYRTFSFIDENNGWAIAGRQKIVRTDDGGQNWTEYTTALNLATGDSLVDMTFADASMGWACAGGKIIKTSDGGATWSIQYADNGLRIYDLFFLDNQQGWAVGGFDAEGYGYFDRSAILKTTDGGTTWQRTNFQRNHVVFSKTQFVSATVGWAISNSFNGGIYKTTDGGISWISQTPWFSQSGTSVSLTDLYFQDTNNGWVIGTQYLAKISNGMMAWSTMNYSMFEYVGAPFAVHAANDIVWVLESNIAYYSVDGGMSWNRSYHGYPNGSYITAAFLSSGKILMASKIGTLTKYLPKTQSCFSSVTILPTLSIPKITPSITAALCEGESITLTASGCSSTLSWSTGATEAAISVTPTATTSYTAYCEGGNGCHSTAYQGVAVIPRVKLDTASAAPCYRPELTATQVWANMDVRWKKNGQLLDYRDIGPYVSRSEGTYTAEAEVAGAWQPQAPTRSSTYQEPKYPNNYLQEVQFVNDSTGFIVGAGNQFLRTTDGGKNWIASKIPASGDRYYSYRMSFIDAMQGWIIGSYNDMEWYGEVLYTSDGGINWGKSNLGAPGSGIFFEDVFFVKTLVGYPAGWAVSYEGQIVNSIDGGYSWSPQTSNTSARLKTLFFLDHHTGWVGGANGTLLTTVDGGGTWVHRTIANVPNFQSLQFLDASKGWAVSENTSNGLYHTRDGGTTWNQVPVDTSHEIYLKKVQFLNDSVGFVQSDRFIHATTDGGATWKKSYHHLNAEGMSFTDATHGWVIGNSIMTYVPAPSACMSDPVTILPQSIVPLTTLASGSWDMPDVWSCGQVPTALDAVRINAGHTITLPVDYAGKAKSMELGGNLVQQGSLQVGQQ
ncbi:WD40/YVTN/BNR-like repeat-containing protein [Salmonirosea aquatica]|uniref:Photosynthesis system II assembly factor Ycf48/Hcf136-like domain-containing protein n=1 Tax=Salmonirosea aquatica TaxID=2654236 RepID=A0A7C9FPB4_9BACT|nr:hypothetical protein [Cytophagaceae bacterium SJW1-29]